MPDAIKILVRHSLTNYTRGCKDCTGGTEKGTVNTIGATGQIGEAALKQLGGKSQVYFQTSQGGRYVDRLVDGVAHESKVGYQFLTQKIRLQIAKDVELMTKGKIGGATWDFFRSPVTGKIGPSEPLREALENAGIQIVEHP
ncbi:hypothetical protein HYR99_26835 [Candidatus Poribacteria bacterium]|nr:hypothetical protein [Candidatus Poribacteria bacterium]